MLGDLGNAIVQFSWKFTASSTKRQLAPPWTALTVITAGDAVSVVGANGPTILVSPLGGTTGTTQPTGAGVDSSVTWVAYPLGSGKALSVTNLDPGNVSAVGDVNQQVLPVPPSYGSSPLMMPNPTGIYAVSASGAALVVAVLA